MKSEDYPICNACGSQFDLVDGGCPAHCKICNDPRQFVPAIGQTWTTLRKMRQEHKNEIKQDAEDKRIWSIRSEPRVPIGERSILLETPSGLILWDLIALLDTTVIDFINSKGSLKAIIISHPHYYTTYIEWAQVFNCPIIISSEDQEWLCRKPPSLQILELLPGPAGTAKTIVPGVTAIKTGGHFPGSLVLHWENKLLIADSIVTVPSAYNPPPYLPGHSSYVFQWSIPNAIPLPPGEILQVWKAIKPFEFDTTHGAFEGMDVRDKALKGRMLESMKIQVRNEGYQKHEMLEEEL